MKKYLLILTLFLLFISCEKEKTIIELEIIDNMPTVVLKLNGKDARFLVDTGASLSLLDVVSVYYNYNVEVSSPIPDYRIVGIGGYTNLHYARNYYLTHNKDTLDIRFMAIDLGGIKHDNDIVGIIGIDYLDTNGIIIDFENKKLIKNK